MKEIPLTRGYVALVDDDDYERVVNCGHRWSALVSSSSVYAFHQISKDNRHIHVSLHNFITGIVPGHGYEVDHVDGNGLNNSKSNLRIVTHAQNMQNRKQHRNSQWPYKGIFKDQRHPGCKKWRARIRIDGKQKHIGYFDTPEEAARAYDMKAREIFGEYARTNFPK